MEQELVKPNADTDDITLQKFIRFCGKALLLAGILILLWWLGLAIFFPLEGMEKGYFNLIKDGDLCVIKKAQYSRHSLFSLCQLISYGLMQSQASLYWQ